MYRDSIEMQVCVNGKPVREYVHEGYTFTEARKGTTYSIKLRNYNHRRGVVILSVDGIDVVSGKKAEEAKTGYIINGYGTMEIKGYRINDNEIATFVFGDTAKSYANFIVKNRYKEKQTKNNGVIGLKVIWEKYKPVPIWQINTQPKWETIFPKPGDYREREYWSDSTAPDYLLKGRSSSANVGGGTYMRSANINYCCQQSETPSFDVGTEWGKTQEDRVYKTDFDWSNDEISFSLFYASRESLLEAGIELESKKKVTRMPQAFGEEYCPKPY